MLKTPSEVVMLLLLGLVAPAASTEFPRWVPATVALDERGELVPGYFPQERSTWLKEAIAFERFHREAHPGGDPQRCQRYIGERDQPGPTLRKLESLVAGARDVITGRIESITVGFLDSRPGSLLTLTTSEHTESAVAVFYPQAVIPAGESLLCASSLYSRYVPVVGDIGIAFLVRGPVAAEGLMIFPLASREIVFVDHAGVVHLPFNLSEQEAAALAYISSRLRALPPVDRPDFTGGSQP